MLSPARRSRFGVSAVLAPRKPMRSARVEQRVIRTRLGLVAAAAANARLIKIRLTPAMNFWIMTISVEAAPPLIKSSEVPVLTSMQLRVQSYVPAPRDFQSHPDVVITTHRYPGRQPGSKPGSRKIFRSDRALQKTPSSGRPAGFVRRGFEPASLLPSRAGQSGCV